MPPIPMKALRSFVYAGHNYVKDQDVAAATASDARFLKAAGRAEQPPALTRAMGSTQPGATYRTRMMSAEQPVSVVTQEPPIVAKTEDEPAPTSDLDQMDAEALHVHAARLGVYVHHRAGAEKVRQAIRESQQSTDE